MGTNWLREPDEFYIGYLPQAPGATSKFIRKFVLLLGIGIGCLAMILVVFQREFSASQFDYGRYTSVSGYIYLEPVPHIVQLQNGVPSVTLAVGFGKKGATEQLNKLIPHTKGGVYGTITGQMITGNGHSLMQVDDHSSFTGLPATAETAPLLIRTSGYQELTGEITDPKCYFGVMKPGEGKPHRSCAIRCIAGGIPPVLHAGDRYYILLSSTWKPVNQDVLGVVGDAITLKGMVKEFGEWDILLIDDSQLKEISSLTKLTRALQRMQAGITQCN